MSQGNSLSSVIDLVSQEKGIDRSVLVEATEHRAAYWRATDVVQLPEGFSL